MLCLSGNPAAVETTCYPVEVHSNVVVLLVEGPVLVCLGWLVLPSVTGFDEV